MTYDLAAAPPFLWLLLIFRSCPPSSVKNQCRRTALLSFTPSQGHSSPYLFAQGPEVRCQFLYVFLSLCVCSCDSLGFPPSIIYDTFGLISPLFVTGNTCSSTTFLRDSVQSSPRCSLSSPPPVIRPCSCCGHAQALNFPQSLPSSFSFPPYLLTFLSVDGKAFRPP